MNEVSSWVPGGLWENTEVQVFPPSVDTSTLATSLGVALKPRSKNRLPKVSSLLALASSVWFSVRVCCAGAVSGVNMPWLDSRNACAPVGSAVDSTLYAGDTLAVQLASPFCAGSLTTFSGLSGVVRHW